MFTDISSQKSDTDSLFHQHRGVAVRTNSGYLITTREHGMLQFDAFDWF